MSLFNPWVLLALICAFLGAIGGSYYKGVHDESARQQLEIARLNDEARQKEQALASAVSSTASLLRISNAKANSISKERDAAIASGSLRLRVPVQSPACPLSTNTDAPATSGDSVQATGELDREIAKSLVAITDQGDANTRQLNACIDAYNTAFQTINQRSKP
jgi:hypothetical protein